MHTDTLRYALVPLLFLDLAAAEWPQFRGPNGAGVADGYPLPAEFSPQKNVAWKTLVPPGHSCRQCSTT